MTSLEKILAHHEADCTLYDAGWVHGCYCGWQVDWQVDETENTPEFHWAKYHAHVADQIREWLLNDHTIEAATKGMQRLSATNRNRYPGDTAYARAALTAALDQGNRDQ